MKGALVFLIGVLALGGCKSHDDALAAQDRALSEQQAEAESLRKRLADDEAVRMVMQRELDQRQAQAQTAEQERDRLRREAEALQDQLAVTRLELAAVASMPQGPVEGIVAPGLELTTRNGGDIVLRIDNSVSFGSGRADLSPNGQRLLAKEVAEILSGYPGYQISIEGHTDDVPIKKSRWKTNLNLSIARALAVREFLSAKAGVSPDTMRVVGYGEARPLIASQTDQARLRNRRVEIVVLKPTDN